MKPDRRTVITRLALGAGAFLGAPLSTQAQSSAGTFPSRPIRLVSSGVVGGLTDSVARIAAERMAISPGMRGQPVIVDNRPGAGGIISMMAVAKGTPDGYSIKIADIGSTSIIPALHRKPPYITLRDFEPVTLIGTTPLFLSVSASLGVSTFAELVALAKAKPGALSYGSSGVGSIHHLVTETMKQQLGINLVHIAYKGSSQSTPALIAGEIQVLFTTIAQVAGHITAGRVRLVAVASPERSHQARNVPTLTELGFKELTFVPSVGALAPAGTPSTIVQNVSEEMRKALTHPDSLQRYARIGIDVVASTPEAYAAILKSDVTTYARAVKLSGASVD
jgi:tripartite-type tricarboxylate transporter receptor subunit TctC